MSLDARPSYGPTQRTRVRRLSERGHYDSETVNAILDEGFVCHLGLCDDGLPKVLPTLYANAGLRSAEAARTACVTVTLVDGLVLARSAFHHSVNYRCVVAFGTASEVADAEEKERALLAIVEHVVPGRSRDARSPSPEELRSTRVTRFDIGEASAKIRTGGPKEDPADLGLTGVWAGVLPLLTVPGPPVPDEEGGPLPPAPGYVTGYGRPGGSA
jgi:nitroimidazol reductase NimA-like FMN-containing flavoprotein (pyridoxamine 5'-phosphate oxidase superfamily)